MLIDNLVCTPNGNGRVQSARVVWEDQDFPSQQLTFEIQQLYHEDWPTKAFPDPDLSPSGDTVSPEAFLAACFPLAAVHGERRVRIEGPACPMLIEGLLTAHAWWSSWGGMPAPAPEIEVEGHARVVHGSASHCAIAFLSGGVDGLHLLMRNCQLYRPHDTAYIRDVLFVHGFDIGKRQRNPETERYRAALKRLAPVAAEAGVRLIPCRTNLRHLPSQPEFWESRHSGAGLAAIGHAATNGPAFVFIGGSCSLKKQVPWGSHPSVDGLFSSQRVTILHDGSRFSRLEKVRDIAHWPAALAALRPCPAEPGIGANCGHCEKCLRTRLELLVAGVEKTDALGPSLTPIELWEEVPGAELGVRSMFYEELIPALRSQGFDRLCRVLEQKLAIYRRQAQSLKVASSPSICSALDGSLQSDQDELL